MDKFRKVAIVILTYNNLEYSKYCLDSIRDHTSGTYEIIIVDNNSTDGTREWLKTQTDIKLKLNDYNAGFPKGCNMGIDMASKDCDILLLNNDTIVTPRWLSNLQTCLYSNKNIGAVGAVCNHDENLQGEDLQYTDLNELQNLTEKNNISDSSRWEEKLFLIGFCILIKREVLDEIGPLDEDYSPGYVEDNDLSLRIISSGYKLMLCHDCFIHHYLGSGFRKDLDSLYPILFANRKTFKRKWGFETWAFDDIKFGSLRVLNESDKYKDIKILDIGCGIGTTLLKIKYDYPNAKLYALEPNQKMAEISKNFAQISINAIDKFPLNYPENFFDYILIGNFLEKVEKPELFITELRKYIKKDGWILAEVQNIMHLSVIRNILSNKWLYSDNDILNRSNKTFFTLGDIHKIFLNCGYRNPFVFHWFSIINEEDRIFIENLCRIGEEKREYLYNSYSFSVRFQK